ncbi:MAG: GtrA family protein [Chloroflexota bacterium]
MSQYNTVQGSNRILRNPVDILIQAVAGRFGEKSKEVERFLKFAVVGFIGAAVDFGTVIVLQASLLSPADKTGTPIPGNVILATSIAFFAAVVSNFLWNRFWTYPDSRSRSLRRQLLMFTFISFVGWLGRTIWISASYHAMGEAVMPIFLPIIHLLRPLYIPSVMADDKMGTMTAQLIGVIVVMFWNFFVNRYWTYNDVKQPISVSDNQN